MVQTDRIKVVAIVGCTAVGKSETALRLAREFDGELVGADSMQIYRGFDIGTGKLTKSECDGIIHHMIDIVDGDADFSVGEYVSRARQVISDIASRGKLPIIVGGTGLYVNSLLGGCDFGGSPKDDGVRSSLKAMSHIFGRGAMHAMLERIDRASADKIAVRDVKRVVRALEIFAVSGRPKSCVVGRDDSLYDYLAIVLDLPRELLYARINARVKKMFDDGLIDEAKSLMRYKTCGSMQALGYKQIAEDPNAPRDVLESAVAQKTRNYAKRQVTYFKNMQLDKTTVDARDYASVAALVEKFTEN